MIEKLKTSIPSLPVPIMTRERFSLLSGLGDEVVRGMLERGQLPSVKVGRHRLVNVARLMVESLSEVCEK